MGRADVETKSYMSGSAHFADLVNYYVFDGNQVVLPEALTPLDTSEVVHNEVRFRRMDKESVELINAVTGSELKIEADKEGKVDVCIAIDEMRKESLDEGMRLGLDQGRREGHRQGRVEGSLETLVHLVEKGMLSLHDAAMEANLSVEEFGAKMKEIN